ncbi:MAG TPA: hypothetical protein VFD92_20560 [Candidatus Binatia bacterium]|nr:hypothetical protein [Candidatus Binatia bacterium]
MLRHLVASCGFALLLVPAAGFATTLPNPPFASGGFVAPDKYVLKQEEYVKKLLGDYLKKRVKCDAIALVNLQLAYTPQNQHKVPDIQASWQGCVQYANDWYAGHRDRLLLKGTPSCLDQTGIDAQKTAVDNQHASSVSAVYCDGDSAAPDPVTGFNIPDEKREVIGENEVAKIVLKAQLSADKCYSRAASYALRNGGTLDQYTLDKIQRCFDKISDHAAAAIADLDQMQKLPACLPPANAQSAVDAATAFSGTSTPAIYCQE